VRIVGLRSCECGPRGLTEPAKDLGKHERVPILRSDWDTVGVGLMVLGTHVEGEIED